MNKNFPLKATAMSKSTFELKIVFHARRRSTGSDTSGGGAGSTDMITKRMDKEAEILRKLKHPNIIGFRGFKRTPDGSRILAIENGQRALFDIIEDRRDSECTPLEAKSILVVIREEIKNIKKITTL